MIRIHKSPHAPNVLIERGATLTQEMFQQVEAGQKPTFDSDVYGAREVKAALSEAQHDKCCFCESKLSHAQFGDVEHFRPKAKSQQSADDTPGTGYYWLAYSWTNLYLSCSVCNTRHKRCLFPLANPASRVSSHDRADDIGTEQPMFIDPGFEDPTASIEYRREYAAPVGQSMRGTATLEALQLNRPPLCERRREKRDAMRAWIEILALWLVIGLPHDRDGLSLVNRISDAASDRGEFASMMRALLREVAPWREDWSPPGGLYEALRVDMMRGRRLRPL